VNRDKGGKKVEVEGGEEEGERRETEKAVLLGFTEQTGNSQTGNTFRGGASR
jgi:hypothetical protein